MEHQRGYFISYRPYALRGFLRGSNDGFAIRVACTNGLIKIQPEKDKVDIRIKVGYGRHIRRSDVSRVGLTRSKRCSKSTG